MPRISPAIAMLMGAALLGGCASQGESKGFYNPDYRIKVMQTPQGYVAIPPECPDWSLIDDAHHDNNMPPNFGCSTARNLAAMVAQPEDLIKPRPGDPIVGVTAASAIDRYYSDRTAALQDPNSKAAVDQQLQSTGITASNPLQ